MNCFVVSQETEAKEEAKRESSHPAFPRADTAQSASDFNAFCKVSSELLFPNTKGMHGRENFCTNFSRFCIGRFFFVSA